MSRPEQRSVVIAFKRIQTAKKQIDITFQRIQRLKVNIINRRLTMDTTLPLIYVRIRYLYLYKALGLFISRCGSMNLRRGLIVFRMIKLSQGRYYDTYKLFNTQFFCNTFILLAYLLTHNTTNLLFCHNQIILRMCCAISFVFVLLAQFHELIDKRNIHLKCLFN